MEISHRKYNVEIIDYPFKTHEGLTIESTAVIDFFGDGGKVIKTKKYGYISTSELYKKIKNGEDINLNQCYIKNFSTKKYRSVNNLEKQSEVALNNFTASEAFFDCDDQTDFSMAHFKVSGLDFSNVQFGHGLIDFEKISTTTHSVLF